MRDIRPGQREAQALASLDRALPRLQKSAPRAGTFTIVGGGPSVADHVEELAEAETIACINHTHDWLIGRGIIPTYTILYEIIEPVAVGITPRAQVTYLIASQCNERTFEHFEGCHVLMWHAANSIPDADLAAREPGAVLVTGGATTAVRALNLGYLMGWRHFAGYGLDSSFDGNSHVYHHADGDCIDVPFNGNNYRTYKIYAKQAEQVIRFRERHADVRMTVHGRGLLPDMFEHHFGD